MPDDSQPTPEQEAARRASDPVPVFQGDERDDQYFADAGSPPSNAEVARRLKRPPIAPSDPPRGRRMA